MNRATLLGRLGHDPELHYTPGGTAVARLSLATDQTYKDRSGAQQKKTDWHKVVAWARLAEIAGEYLKKGAQVYIEGRIETRKYDDKQGVAHSITEIVASRLVLLGGPRAAPAGDAPPESEPSEPAGEPEITDQAVQF